jgi:tRNA-dihydrouridine synthase
MLALRGESDALRGEGFPPARTLAPTPIRLPGGEQLGVYDPTEGLGDDAGADGGDWSCAVDEPELDGEPPGSGNASDDPDASTPSSLRHSVAPSRSSFAAIDVNLACPVKKIEKKSRGGHWLTEPRGAIALLEAVRDATPAHIPCTVKLRRSFDDTPEMVDNFHAIFAAAYDMGYAWATVHARTVEQKYVGPSRWTFLRDLRELHPDKIILGSGDTWSVVDIFRMIAYAGMSGVSVARGCIGNPWIFRQARDMMAGSAPRVPTIPEQRAVLAEHFRLSLAVTRRFRHAEQATSMMMRKFAIRFAMHHARSDEVRKRFIAVQSAAQWQQVLDEFYRD